VFVLWIKSNFSAIFNNAVVILPFNLLDDLVICGGCFRISNGQVFSTISPVPFFILHRRERHIINNPPFSNLYYIYIYIYIYIFFFSLPPHSLSLYFFSLQNTDKNKYTTILSGCGSFFFFFYKINSLKILF
jgi:hypothetical protein